MMRFGLNSWLLGVHVLDMNNGGQNLGNHNKSLYDICVHFQNGDRAKQDMMRSMPNNIKIDIVSFAPHPPV